MIIFYYSDIHIISTKYHCELFGNIYHNVLGRYVSIFIIIIFRIEIVKYENIIIINVLLALNECLLFNNKNVI